MRLSTLVVAATLIAGSAAAQIPGTWNPALGVPGVSGNVFAVEQAPDGTVYVGGDFTVAGGVPALGVARWTGSAWEALGTGLAYPNRTAIAYALTIGPDGDLYVGGQFQTAGGVPASSVARWDGAVWSGLGDGLSGASFPSAPLVRGLDFDDAGDLYVGGTFTTAGVLAASNAARWDGSVWSALGAGTNQALLAVVADGQGGVFVSGRFTQAGGTASPGVARWNGTEWSALGSGLTLPFLVGGVFAMTLDGAGRLYVSGSITGAGGKAVANVARWDGTAWSAVGDGLSGGSALALRYDPATDLVYAGGRFTASGSTALPRVAAWTGTGWQPLGTGVDAASSPVVYGFSTPSTSGSLFASGAFTSAGDQPAVGVAQWLPVTTSADGGPASERMAISAWPNPTAGRASVSFTLTDASPVRLEVLDRLGRSIVVLADETRTTGRHTVALDTTPFAPGVYVVRVQAGAQVATARVTVIR